MVLKELREKKGLNQQQLADELGLQRNTISRYETGKREPDQETLLRLSDFFGVSVDYLLRGENKEAPPIEAGEAGAAEFGQRLFAAHGDIAPEDFTEEDLDDVAMFLQLKKMKKDKKDG